MSTIILPHRWTTQPKYPVAIDPLYAPVFAWHGGNRSFDSVTRTAAALYGGSAAWGYGGAGVAAELGGNTSNRVQVPSVTSPGSNFIAIVQFQNTSATTDGILLAGKTLYSNPNGFMFESKTNANTIEINGGDGTTFPTLATPTGLGSLDGKVRTVVVQYVGTKVYAWMDGLYLGMATVAAAGTWPSGIGIGNYAGTGVGNNPARKFFMAAVVLNGDPQSLSRNPWQIFRPITKRIYVGVSSANTYTLTAAQGSFTETGNAATLALNRAVTAAKGAFTLTGQDATFPRSRVFTADKGTFNLTGNAASFQYGSTYALTAERGAFSLTGNTATFPRSRVFAVDSGSIVLTGNAADFAYVQGQRTLAASGGTFALTGIPSYGTFLRQVDLDYLLWYMQENLVIPTAAQIATAVWQEQIDGTTTAEQSIRLHNAVLAGKVSGAGTGTEVFRDLADTKDRVTSTVDSDGNRTAVTTNVT